MSGIINRAGSKSGIINNGKGIGFFACGNGEGSVAYADNAVIILATVPYNEGNGYDNSNGRFTAPVTGLYHFDFIFYPYGGSNVYAPYLTDSAAVDWGRMRHNFNDDQMGTWSQNAYLTKGMYIFVKSTGGTRTFYLGNKSHTRFSGHLIGEE